MTVRGHFCLAFVRTATINCLSNRPSSSLVPYQYCSPADLLNWLNIKPKLNSSANDANKHNRSTLRPNKQDCSYGTDYDETLIGDIHGTHTLVGYRPRPTRHIARDRCIYSKLTQAYDPDVTETQTVAVKGITVAYAALLAFVAIQSHHHLEICHAPIVVLPIHSDFTNDNSSATLTVHIK